MRVLVADDHPLMRRALAGLLRDEFQPVDVTEVGNGAAAAEAWREGEWSLALLDISMPVRSGLEVLEVFHAMRPTVPVLVVSALAEAQYAQRALHLGAAGFVGKESAVEDLATAIRRVLRGGRYVSPSLGEILASAVLDELLGPPHTSLSPREFAIFLRLAAGAPVGEISRGLHLSVKTVSTYRARLFGKMGLKSNAEATRYALRHSLIEE